MQPLILRSMAPALLAAVLSFATPGARAASADPDLDRLATLLAGSFSSEAQALADSDYRDVRLHMVQIWPDRAGEHWLYVEQALAENPQRPYRQRVYQLVRRNGDLRSLVYTLPGDPLVYAGAWTDTQRFARLQPKDLSERHGCSIQLHSEGAQTYAGSTLGHDCSSDMKGATYASSEVRLDETTLRSWDRGFNSENAQVWGAEKGAYIFNRLAAGP